MNKRKRGVSLPWRHILMFTFIILQLAFFIACVSILSYNFLFLYTFLQILSIITVIFIVNKTANPSYKITWLIFILLLPPVGALFYLFYGTSLPVSLKKKAYRKIENDAHTALKPDVVRSRNYNILSNEACRQSKFLTNTSGYPLYAESAADYISPGENILSRLLDELKKAEKYIFIEFFILAQGEMWNQIHSIIRKKAMQGVDVRIMFDDFGSINRQYAGFVKGLRSEGIKVTVFNPIRPSIDLFMNNRNHRKIVVIDGKTALTGGFNIGDEYINKWKRHGYWMDSAVFVAGDAAYGFAVMFLNMWSFVTKKKVDFELYRPDRFVTEKADGFVQPYCDGPLNKKNPAKGIYMQIINNANRYVYITTPYLIIDNEMMAALCLAAGAGVDVRIVTPKIWDKWYVHPVTQSSYGELLKNGIRIYEYTPGFIHSKLTVCDDSIATVGTVNMDYRSFYFHFECGLWLHNNKAVGEVRDDILKIMAVSEEIKLSDWKKRPLYIKIKQAILHIFAPFL